MPEQVELLERLYHRFNARDMESLLAALHPDVVWANRMERGYLYGREPVRSYWTRQWAMANPPVEPVEFASDLGGMIYVEAHELVHDLNGTLVTDEMESHVLRIEDGLIKRFDIRGA
jgi:hypothetical protein